MLFLKHHRDRKGNVYDYEKSGTRNPRDGNVLYRVCGCGYTNPNKIKSHSTKSTHTQMSYVKLVILLMEMFYTLTAVVVMQTHTWLKSHRIKFTHTHTRVHVKWWNLNNVGRLHQCQFPGYDIVLQVMQDVAIEGNRMKMPQDPYVSFPTPQCESTVISE